MASVRIEFNRAGFREVLTSSAAKRWAKDVAEGIAEKANAVPSTTDPEADEAYYVVEDESTDRARFKVRTDGARAARHEAKTQALLRGLGG